MADDDRRFSELLTQLQDVLVKHVPDERSRRVVRHSFAFVLAAAASPQYAQRIYERIGIQ